MSDNQKELLFYALKKVSIQKTLHTVMVYKLLTSAHFKGVILKSLPNNSLLSSKNTKNFQHFLPKEQNFSLAVFRIFAYNFEVLRVNFDLLGLVLYFLGRKK